MNPVLLKELRSLLRERRGFLVPMIYAAVLSAAVFLFFLSVSDRRPAMVGSWIAGLLQGVPIATHTSAWYYTNSLLLIGAMVALSAWAFRASIAGRRILNRDLFG